MVEREMVDRLLNAVALHLLATGQASATQADRTLWTAAVEVADRMAELDAEG
jgi:hypothetical protein